MKKVACRRAPPSVSNTRGHNRCDLVIEYPSLKHKVFSMYSKALGCMVFESKKTDYSEINLYEVRTIYVKFASNAFEMHV